LAGVTEGMEEAEEEGAKKSSRGRGKGEPRAFQLDSGTYRLKEMSFGSGGLGWKAWSAAKMLARLIERNPESVSGLRVLGEAMDER